MATGLERGHSEAIPVTINDTIVWFVFLGLVTNESEGEYQFRIALCDQHPDTVSPTKERINSESFLAAELAFYIVTMKRFEYKGKGRLQQTRSEQQSSSVDNPFKQVNLEKLEGDVFTAFFNNLD